MSENYTTNNNRVEQWRPERSQMGPQPHANAQTHAHSTPTSRGLLRFQTLLLTLTEP